MWAEYRGQVGMKMNAYRTDALEGLHLPHESSNRSLHLTTVEIIHLREKVYFLNNHSSFTDHCNQSIATVLFIVHNHPLLFSINESRTCYDEYFHGVEVN